LRIKCPFEEKASAKSPWREGRHEETIEMEQPLSQPDPAEALANIVDDTAEVLEAHRWAREELIEGRMPEELVAEMTAGGWELDEAERIVETARKDTRAERGVVTREDIVRELNGNHRRATAGVMVAFRSQIGLFGWVSSFMSAMRSMRKLKTMARSRTAGK
jgi:hypothetical protein